jgi:hypothetical protein
MRQLGPDEWKQLIAEYESVEVDQKEFVAKHDLSINTFRFWLYKLRKQKKSQYDSAARFLPVTVVASPAPKARERDDADLIEVVHRSVTVRFAVGTNTRYIAQLLAALG